VPGPTAVHGTGGSLVYLASMGVPVRPSFLGRRHAGAPGSAYGAGDQPDTGAVRQVADARSTLARPGRAFVVRSN
jgi:hypothetical protein